MNNIPINDNYVSELNDSYKRAYNDYKDNKIDIDHWGSHQPLLIHLVNTITSGDIIEFGMGDNSTPLLHLLCQKQGRKLFSYDFESAWYNKYKSFENENHKIFLLSEELFRSNVYQFNVQKYSIAFIDSHPTWTRHHAIKVLKDCVDYFIIHDSFFNTNGNISVLNPYDFTEFKNVMHFTKVTNGSSIFSNNEFPEEVKKIFYE